MPLSMRKILQFTYKTQKVLGVLFSNLNLGTWVNGNRLSPSGIESNPQIIIDDDIIQFGEDTDYDGSKSLNINKKV